MKIGVSCLSLSAAPFQQAIIEVAKNFSSWRIISEGKHQLRLIEKSFLDIVPSYNINISVHAPFSDINIASINPSMRASAIKEILETIEIASKLGVTLVVLHPGKYPGYCRYPSEIRQKKEKDIQKSNKESLNSLANAARENGITLALENMPKIHGMFCTNTDEMLYAIEDTDITICFDVGHANIAGGVEDFLDHLNKFSSVELHDNQGVKDEHLPLGTGNVNFTNTCRKILQTLASEVIVESLSIDDGVRSKRYLESILKDFS